MVIQLGDSVIDIDFQVFLNSKYSTLGVSKVHDPRRFGVVELNEKSFVKKLIEKPQIPISNLAIVGLYFIKEFKCLYNALDFNIKNGLKTRGEYHLTDGLMKMVEDGSRIEVMEVKIGLTADKRKIYWRRMQLCLIAILIHRHQLTFLEVL